jgi:hypothetical protein
MQISALFYASHAVPACSGLSTLGLPLVVWRAMGASETDEPYGRLLFVVLLHYVINHFAIDGLILPDIL